MDPQPDLIDNIRWPNGAPLMKSLRILPALGVVVLLHACAPAPVVREDSHAPPPSFGILSACNSAPGSDNTTNCTITVSVLEVDPDDTNKCKIELSGDADLITFKQAAGSKIVWKIASAGNKHVFTRDGIAFIDNFRPRMFKDAERSANGEEFSWTINRNLRRVNAYVISVRTKSGVTPARECELDPWIRSRT